MCPIQIHTIHLSAVCLQDRCQVFAAITYAAVDNELAAPRPELTRKLLELLLQACVMELKEPGKLSFNFLSFLCF